MREIPWKELGEAGGGTVVQWGDYAITRIRLYAVHPNLTGEYTLWRKPLPSGLHAMPWIVLASTSSELTVRAWLIEFKHPDFTRGGSDA